MFGLRVVTIVSVLLSNYVYCLAQVEERYSLGLTGAALLNSSSFKLSSSQAQIGHTGSHGGLSFMVKNTKYATFKMDIVYSSKGIGYQDFNIGYQRILDMIDVPLISQFEIGNRNLRILLSAGIQYSKVIGQTEKYALADSLTIEEATERLKITIAQNNSFKNQVGIIGGAGLMYNINKISVAANAYYYQSYTNIIRPETLSYFRLQSFVVSMGVYYHIFRYKTLEPLK
jgi:hypothetical protein